MFIGWLTCIPAVLHPHSLCRSTTANAPANRQMPIASVVRRHFRKKRKKERIMIRFPSILLTFFCLTLLTNCDNFEKKFYDHIDQGQINAIKNGTDTFDLATITDFEWDSVLLVRGNESVPEYKEFIEETLNNKKSTIDWEDRAYGGKIDPTLTRKTKDLEVNRDRFYFLTPEKKIIEKEIKSGIHCHKPAFDLELCLVDTLNKREWLSRKECKFILKSNVQTIGEGTVILYSRCRTEFSPGSLKYFDEEK